MTTVLIADDEPRLAAHLQARLATLWPDARIVGIAENGRQALELLETLTPDVAFLDIKMPGLTGLEVANEAPERTRLVFVTAFDQYAVDAFAAAAVDYLLKPVTDDRLMRTIDRLRQIPQVDRDLIKNVLSEMTTPEREWLQWLRVGRGDAVQLVNVAEVFYLRSDRKYTSVVSEAGEAIIRTPLKELEESLDPTVFWRVHRGIIVNVARIEAATRDRRGRYQIRLKGADETLPVSDSYAYRFKQM